MFDKINNDLIRAMKEQDKFSLAVLRLLKSALQLESINKKENLTDDEVIAVIKKQIKMRMDSITEFEKFDKTEKVEVLNQEIYLLKQYLPEELSEEEVDRAIDSAFVKINPASMKDMGMVSKKVKDKLMNM